MIMLIKKLLETTAAAEEKARQLAEMETDEAWAVYLAEAERQRKLWQYVHYFVAGANADGRAEREQSKAGAPRCDLLQAMAAAEWEKAMLCQNVCQSLNGAAKQAVDAVFRQALRYSGQFLAMAYDERARQTAD
ncbi:hypothetical protein [Geobacillus sp. YHL]|uniref:hypothetical protein n=1 Tax=Geobacillus sp. YHL TaxID=2796117 RepID=UPI001EF09DF0|nr:hypothetical protein [Geobacillus sp. YHL]MCG6794250.1 hypothetical protein [Geobacillus sp. YHL]